MAMGWRDGDYLERPLHEFLDDVGGDDPAPAAGSVTAATVALAAALTAKVALRSTAQLSDAAALAERAAALRSRVSVLITADASSYAAVLAALRSGTGREKAMAEAVRIPGEIAAAAADIAELAAVLAARGNPNLRYDALAAADLAERGAAVAASLVSANSADDDDADRASQAAFADARRAAEAAGGILRPTQAAGGIVRSTPPADQAL